jgi:hypothetical protein
MRRGFSEMKGWLGGPTLGRMSYKRGGEVSGVDRPVENVTGRADGTILGGWRRRFGIRRGWIGPGEGRGWAGKRAFRESGRGRKERRRGSGAMEGGHQRDGGARAGWKGGGMWEAGW